MGENILYEYEEIIINFDINKNIFCIISYNVINMVKVFNFGVLGFVLLVVRSFLLIVMLKIYFFFIKDVMFIVYSW